METLDQTVWVHINYRSWQGKKTLTRAEVNKFATNDIPPEDLITPGSKAIADPEKLKAISSLGKKIHRECEKVCLKAFGAYGTSIEASEALLVKLQDYKDQHQQLVSDYLDSYDQSNDDWVAEHPQWSDWLKHSMLARKDIENRFKFDVQAYKISSGGESALLNDGLQKEQSGLLGTLLREIEKMAENAWETSFLNKEKTSQKALRPINTILNKLETLSYIDGKVSVIVRRVKAVLDAMPKTGFIEGADLSAACGLLNLLSSSDRMIAFAKQAGTAVIDPMLDDESDSVDVETHIEVDVMPATVEEVEEEEEEEVLASPSAITPSLVNPMTSNLVFF